MAVKVPSVGQLAFKGNVRRGMKKVIAGNKSIVLWMQQHGQWPVILLGKNQLAQLNSIAQTLAVGLLQKVPPAKPQ